MRTLCSRGLLIAVAALSLAFGAGMPGNAAAGQSEPSGSAAWLDTAVLEKHCPSQPVNVLAALLQTSDAALRRRVSIVGDALDIGGTAGPDHIVVRAGGAPNLIRVWLDGRFLGSFGPVARIVVQGGGGNDVVIVGPKVELPARLEGGAGDDCLEGGGGGDELFGGNGNDVLIAGTGRPALDPGTGNDRIIVPQRMGELRVAPSAAGQLLPLLTRIYRLRSISQGSGLPAGQEAVPSPIVLGAQDLRDPRIAPLLQQTYDAGQAVALTDATAADAARLRRVLGQPNAAQGPASGKRAALIFFRKASRPGAKVFDYATGIFSQAPTPASPAASRRSDEQNIALLSRVFSATAIVPEARAGAPSDDLLQLADSYTTSKIARNPYGGSVQLVSPVWDIALSSITRIFTTFCKKPIIISRLRATSFPLSRQSSGPITPPAAFP